MKAKSIQGMSADQIQTALQHSMADGFKPTLAIVFLSIKQDREAICELLDKQGIAVFGATTNGEFTDEGISKESVAILLLDINRSYYSILFEEFPEKNYREVAQSLAKEALTKIAVPSFLIAASNMETDAEQLVFGFEDIAGKQVNIYGGNAGDDFAFTEQFVFTNKRSSNRGIVVLALDEEKILIRGRATCGWKAIGTEKTVTKSIGNHVFTVDDIPVLDLTIKYGGLENVTPENFAMEFSIALPMQLQRETGDPVMRPGLLVDWSDHSFYCSGTVPQGSKVRFSLPPDFDVIDKVIQGCEALKMNEIPEADALVIFSCAGRLVALGPLISEEIEGVNKLWDVPMAGIFSNGEMARVTGGNVELCNLTTCCVAIKER